MDPLNQRLLRSLLICFRMVRLHQSSYIEASGKPEECARFSAMWADEQR